MQKSFPSVLPKRVYQTSLWLRLFHFISTPWKQRTYLLASEKGLEIIKVTTPPVIIRLSPHGAVCFRPFFCVQQSLKTRSVTTQELPNYLVLQNPTCQIDSPEKRDKQAFICQNRHSNRKNFVLTRIKLFNLHTLIIFGWCRFWSFTFRPYSTTASRKGRHSRHLLYLLDAAGITSALVLNQKAQTKGREGCVPFKIWTSEAQKIVHKG